MRCSAVPRRLRVTFVGLFGLLLSCTATAQELDDPPKTIKADEAVTEEQDDRIEASSLYAHGHMLLQRRDLPGALRRFERAWRFDPELVSIMEEIVPIAVTLKRNDEASTLRRDSGDETRSPSSVVRTNGGDPYSATEV